MTDQRITALEDRMSELLANGGAQLTMQDPRVSQVQNWLLGLVGVGIVSALIWGANSINRLNDTMARYAATSDAILYRLNDHNDRIKEIERRNVAR